MDFGILGIRSRFRDLDRLRRQRFCIPLCRLDLVFRCLILSRWLLPWFFINFDYILLFLFIFICFKFFIINFTFSFNDSEERFYDLNEFSKLFQYFFGSHSFLGSIGIWCIFGLEFRRIHVVLKSSQELFSDVFCACSRILICRHHAFLYRISCGLSRQIFLFFRLAQVATKCLSRFVVLLSVDNNRVLIRTLFGMDLDYHVYCISFSSCSKIAHTFSNVSLLRTLWFIFLSNTILKLFLLYFDISRFIVTNSDIVSTRQSWIIIRHSVLGILRVGQLAHHMWFAMNHIYLSAANHLSRFSRIISMSLSVR